MIMKMLLKETEHESRGRVFGFLFPGAWRVVLFMLYDWPGLKLCAVWAWPIRVHCGPSFFKKTNAVND